MRCNDDPGIQRREGNDMKVNVGGLDKIVRIVAGAALIALAVTGTIGAWGWIGIVPLATGLLGICPLYSILGVNTCPLKKAS
jgi:Protein of unknown function (DUF2892)